MTDPKKAPFQRDEQVDEPGISGARWWQEAMRAQDDDDGDEVVPSPGRRSALTLLLGAGALAAVGGVAVAIGSRPHESWERQPRPALTLQREYGWAFGAATEKLVFDGATLQPFDRTRLSRLADDCSPSRPELARLAIPTLFEAPSATPRSVAQRDPQTFVKLSEVLEPVSTPAMGQAYARGAALADLFGHASRPPLAAVIVDLPGADSVAFAAGAATTFEPVFLFDNWPHPRGVVPAHQTLGALAFYQPRFANTRGERPGRAPPLFVLDRNRLRSYVDDASEFDNRHLARLPGPGPLRALGLERVLYVTTDAGAGELDDVNDVLADCANGRLEVRMLAATDLGVVGDEAFYGGRRASHESFWSIYPWADPTRGLVEPALLPQAASSWRPVQRATHFSGNSAAPTRPPGFGMVPVIVAAGTGLVLGAALSRSGSWTRSSGGWGG